MQISDSETPRDISQGEEQTVGEERSLDPAVEKTTRQYAYSWGKSVIRDLERVGATQSSVDASRKRMREWLELVEKYEKSVKEVQHDAKLKHYERSGLVADMYVELEKQRAKVFGD
jgi:hypothetical protein